MVDTGIDARAVGPRFHLRPCGGIPPVRSMLRERDAAVLDARSDAACGAAPADNKMLHRNRKKWAILEACLICR